MRSTVLMRLLLVGLLTAGAAATLPSSASAQGTPSAPYGGLMPFNCELQYVGLGTNFPHPGADPFCVEFDKSQQNVTDLGLLDFASREPARVAAAGPKCFYFQRDHWTGTIVQGSQPELYHFDGSYFFDKATGAGGVHVDNFRIGGQPADARPYVPPQYQPYFGPGGGGFLSASEVPVDPSCAAMVATQKQRTQVYFHTVPAGEIARWGITPVGLGTTEGALHDSLGPPYLSSGGTQRFAVQGGGQLRVAYRGGAGAERVGALLTTALGDTWRGIHPGSSVSDARRVSHARFAFRLARYRVLWRPSGRRRRLYFGLERGRVSWIAVATRGSVRSRRRALDVLGRLALGPVLRVDSTGLPY